MRIKYQIFENNFEKRVRYPTRIHGIPNDHPYITVPKRILEETGLEVGSDLLIKINYNNKEIPFISYLTKGAHVVLVCVPKLIVEKSGLGSDTGIDIELVIKQYLKNEVSDSRIDLLFLDLNKISRFIFGKELYVRYKGRKSRQHIIKRFVEVSKELAYITGLYDAEGAEKSFRFTNSDPKLIKVFLNTIKSVFGLGESEFDAQLTLVHKSGGSPHARTFWSKLFPQVNIYNKIGLKYGEGVEYGSLSVLINTMAMNTIWNAIRDVVQNKLINNEKLSSAYISGVLDGDGNVHKNKSLEVRCTFDIKKGHSHFSEALKTLEVFNEVVEVPEKNQYTLIIRGWDNIMQLFNKGAIFQNKLNRREKLIKHLIEHRRSKVILRTLKAIRMGNHNEKSICDAMGIQRKHIARVRSYLRQLESHKMISYKGNNIYLNDNGKNFLELLH